MLSDDAPERPVMGAKVISNHAFVNSFAKKMIQSKPFVIFATHSNRLTL